MSGKALWARRARLSAGVALLLLTMLALLAACGDDDDGADPLVGTPVPADDGAADPTPTPTPQDAGDATLAPTPTPTPTPETVDDGPEVRSASIADFALPSMTIDAGTVVRFTNNDSAPHTATEVDGAWDSGNLNQGDSWEHEFSEVGTFEYYCAVHPTMTGTITVE